MKKTDTEMGKISNLITDMTIIGATDDELARAVRHSMVVIDAEKHHLDYKQSEKDNNIQALSRSIRSKSTRTEKSNTVVHLLLSPVPKENILLISDRERLSQTFQEKNGMIHPGLMVLLSTRKLTMLPIPSRKWIRRLVR